MHWVLHVLGIDTQQSYWYDLWSGIGAKIDLLFLACIYLWHHNCHVKHCPRIGHPHNGTVYCKRHLPENSKNRKEIA
jgi:hypothetical protein